MGDIWLHVYGLRRLKSPVRMFEASRLKRDCKAGKDLNKRHRLPVSCLDFNPEICSFLEFEN